MEAVGEKMEASLPVSERRGRKGRRGMRWRTRRSAEAFSPALELLKRLEASRGL